MISLKSLRSHRGLLALTLIAALFACSDDDTPTEPGTTDKDPPEVSSVTPINGFQLELAFNEEVLRQSAEQVANYAIVEQAPPAAGPEGEKSGAPGDPIELLSVSLKPDNQTVAISTADQMGAVPYQITVTNVYDVHGNQMTSSSSGAFTGTGSPDQTPPEIVLRTPAPGATGVGTLEPVIVQFSEMVFPGSVVDGFSWTHGGGSVVWQIENLEGGDITYSFTPVQPLSLNTVYTVAVTGVSDRAGNQMSPMNWSFTTTAAPDLTPPTLVSSEPSHLDTNVATDVTLRLTFSEPILQEGFEPAITPDVGDGLPVWSNGGRTVSFQPDQPLLPNTQYYLAILPGDMEDFSGNGNIELEELLFTTGSSFASGSISGTVSGDPNSDFADDPSGALVIAADADPFGENDDFGVGSSDIVGGDGSYSMDLLPDGTYFPVSAMDSNGDGEIDPDEGDAIGAYGIDLSIMDVTPDPIVISAGNDVADADFRLFDPSAIVGSFSYEGIQSGGYYVYVGVFDAVEFDPTQPPLLGVREFWPSNAEWSISGLDGELVDGSYAIAAFMDLDFDEMYDPGVEPAGVYGGLTPTTIVIARGSDALGVHIVLEDPNGMAPGPAVAWPNTSRSENPWLQRISARIREATGAGN